MESAKWPYTNRTRYGYKKYHNQPCYGDGILFDSKREARRYLELKLLLSAGEISNLVLQPKFTLQEKFRDRTGIMQRAIVYFADFQYNDKKYDWHLVVEDAKGLKTKEYKIKKKLFLKQHPEIIFIET